MGISYYHIGEREISLLSDLMEFISGKDVMDILG